MSDTTATVEQAKDFGGPQDKGAQVRRWLAEIKAYSTAFDEWQTRGQKIVDRYRVESQDRTGARFNILWSNVETLKSAIYMQPPKPDVQRRYKDRDVVGLAAATILERCVSHGLDTYDFDYVAKLARDDYLLPGRGVVWVRYVPYYGEEVTPKKYLKRRMGEDLVETYEDDNGQPVDKDVKFDDANEPYIDDEPYRPVTHEEAICDFISWKDFGHTPAPNWSKVRAVWKRELLTRDQLIERFGKKVGEAVSLTKVVNGMSDKDAESFGDIFKRAEVFEIWDKPTRKAIWISPGYTENVLDEKDDPLHLEHFFPCPRPLYATMTGDKMVPVPDYKEYEDQANEIDVLTQRMGLLIKALKVAGAYDSSSGGVLEGLLQGEDNKLIPVDNWAMFAEKGGLKGSISFLPLAEISTALTAMAQAREQLKRDLYEITGISDIVRGQATSSRATATEQRIKGEFANLRLEDKKKEMQRFLRDVLRIKAEIISEHFSRETILEMSGFMQTIQARMADKRAQAARQQADAAMMQYQQAQQQAQMAAMQGQPVQPLPPPPQVQIPPDAMQIFDEAVKLLKDDKLRSFRVDIETNSTVMEDAVGEKEARTEFLGALGQFLAQAIPASEQYPKLMPALSETLFFGIRGFKAGRDVETAWENAIEDMTADPPQPKPDPEQAKVEIEKMKAQVEREKMDRQAQIDAANLQAELARLQQEQEMAREEHQMKMAEMQAKHRLEMAKLQAEMQKMGLELQAEQQRMVMDEQMAEREAQREDALADRAAQRDDAVAERQAERQDSLADRDAERQDSLAERDAERSETAAEAQAKRDAEAAKRKPTNG